MLFIIIIEIKFWIFEIYVDVGKVKEDDYYEINGIDLKTRNDDCRKRKEEMRL